MPTMPVLRLSSSGLQPLSSTFAPGLRSAHTFTSSSFTPCRHLSSRALNPSPTTTHRFTSSRLSILSTTTPPPPSTGTPSSFFTPSLCRHASTTSTAPSSQPASASNSSSPDSVILDWNNFFRLRTSRRRYSLASSVVSSVATTAGSIVFMQNNPELSEYVTRLIPTDPAIAMGVATFVALLVGWLIGPVFGSALWRLLHRSRLPEFTVKERAFFERIKKHRVNPAGASANNPVPDFYGEKVGSVSGYRTWLKDQRAFNRKRSDLTA